MRAALQDGLAHGSRIEPHDPVPGIPVTLLFSTNTDLPIECVAVYYTTDGSVPAGARGVASNGNVVMAVAGEAAYDAQTGMQVRYWRAMLPAQPDGTLVRYRADGWSEETSHNPADSRGHWFADNDDPINLPTPGGRVFAYAVDRWLPPEWFAEAIIYHVFVDRFHAAHDEPALRADSPITGFFGGTLRGVLEKLDYIQALGVNCIWLSPIFESPVYHGYNPSDYYNVARHYGTNETIRQLIDEAHRRGMRVMLDFVANHTSDEHPAFVEARTDPDSPQFSWYAIGDWPPHGYRSYALVKDMPELVTEHPDVQRYLCDAVLYWLREFGADGVRLDYVPGPTHAFWTLFQREIKRSFPQALTLGEITSPLPEIANYAGRMDAFMDFPLTKMLRRTFGLRTASLADLLTYLDEREPELPQHMGRATLLDNHDMHRFLWLAGGNTAQLKLAATCHLTLEGTPIIYYGTEVGLSQYSDAHKENAYARPAMLWDERQDTSLLEHYRRLIALRRQHRALLYGKRINIAVGVLDAPDELQQQVGAYLRCHEHDFLLVVLNNGQQPARIRIPLAEQLASAGIHLDAARPLHNVLSLEKQQISLVNGVLEYTLEPLDAAVIGA